MGTLVKDYFAAKQGLTPNQIYHVTVMPCYDKKLEASRQDFYSDLYRTRDVDCVITTGKLGHAVSKTIFLFSSLEPKTWKYLGQKAVVSHVSDVACWPLVYHYHS